ncbi:LOW QUALITY PROTEIN: uncharacterized protein [Drosophila pseudoobscura]|uniref:LOW QUALITY PROTEIN: uncharacterized protein n=1 Tax=Drosophila pseudoobscura pseudoobscura TaxID=46245 RepID=A0A6I8UCV3_DROPS|nr:LOW QUALITY PROTEIN: uncharacterized protein LOC4813775 [Drosophila pseudoobscura]
MLHHQKSEDPAAIAGLMKLLKQPASQTVRSESMTWLVPGNSSPIWSRRLRYNLEGRPRHQSDTRWREFDVEIENRLWSMWGGLHPRATWFDSKVRGRQSLGCYVVACCAASIFRRLGDWTSKLLDAIVVNGDKYYRASVEYSQRWDQNLGPDEMSCRWSWWPSGVYSAPASSSMSLLEALSYFFTRFQWGILECQERRLAFGFSSSHDGGYFLYDCSEWDKPIFPDGMGASYLLRARQLMVLLYCMVVTLNLRCKKVGFRLYNVDMVRLPSRNGSSSSGARKDNEVSEAKPT